MDSYMQGFDEFYVEASKLLIDDVAKSLSYSLEDITYRYDIATYIAVDNINLEMLANSLGVFGITDILGQISSWLMDRLKEFSSWISSAVESITRPIKTVVDYIWSFIQRIPDAVISGIRGFLDTFAKSLSDLGTSVSSLFNKVFSQISSVFSSILTSLQSVASNILSSLSSAMSSVISTITSAISDFVTRLWSGIQTIGSAVVSGFERISSMVSSAVTSIIQGVQSLIAQIGSTIQSIGQNILGSIQGFVSMVQSGIQGFVSSLTSLINNVWGAVQQIGGALAGIADRIWSGLQTIGQSIIGAVQSFVGMVQGAINSVASALSGLISRIWDGIQSFGSAVSGFFSRIWEGIQSGLRWLWDGLQGIIGRVWDGLQTFGRMVSDFFVKLWDGIQSGFRLVFDQIKGFGNWLWGNIQGGLKWLWDAVTGIGTKIWEGIQWYVKTTVDLYTKLFEGLQGFGKIVSSGIEGLGTALRNYFSTLQNWLSGAFEVVGNALSGVGKIVTDGFVRVGQAFSDFAKIFDKWATTLLSGIQAIGSGFTQFLQAIANLPQTIQNIFSGIIKFFERVGEGIVEFVKSPFEFLRKYLIEPLWTGIKWLAGKIWEGLQWLWQKIVEGAQWIWNALQQAGQWMLNAIAGIANAIQNAFIGIANTLAGFGKTVYEFIINMFMKIKETASEAIQKYVKEVISEFMTAVGWGSPPGLTTENFVKAWGTSLLWSLPLYAFALAVEIPIRGIAYGLGFLARKLSGLDLKIRLSLKFLGAGGDFEFNFAKALGDALNNFSKEMLKHAEKFYEPFWMGIGFWFGRYASTLLIYMLRNFIPIEIPSFREAEEIWNRIRSTGLASFKTPESVVGSPKDAEEVVINFLKMKGYSDYVLKLAFADENEFYIEIEDRFKVKRRIPLADAWRVPPPSDIITMMIRDVIIEPNYFAAVMRMQGFNKDTSILYYYLHYKYPSPEKLAGFYWRGMARVLWFDKTLEEEGLKTFLGLEAYKASPPMKINERPDVLNNMIMKYMKWHDYAPFPWDNEFPTDKSIIVELMADLPDKVDFRWLTRYGIIEHMSSLGVKMDTTIDKIVSALQGAKGNELLSRQVSPEISLDVSLLSRFLIARGVHPYFASIVAVAESHVMLTDELTFLRSGFIELYRWGMANIHQLESLMSGLFVIKFTTGYINTDGSVVTYTYNKPVLWLPAERRLLQLRAAMDRYYMLFRDFVREVERGVRFLALHTKSTAEEIKKYVSQLKLDKETSEEVNRSLSYLEKYEKAEDLIHEYGKIITERLRDEISKIAGVDVTFTIDDMYVDTWVKSAVLTRAIESRTWIRHYSTRLIAWILYRTSYGWTDISEFSNLTTVLMSRGWLTVEEKEFLDVVASWVYRIVRREMIPTPIQLATFSEYMKVPDNIIDKVLDDHRVPDEYRQLYKQYITYRFIKSDYRTYLNRARRAYVMGIINDSEWSNIIAEAVNKYGFRQEEIAIMQRLGNSQKGVESL
jgi:phage-related protein